jgi:hypothetical protein
MTSTKYIGLDVHKESISIAVLNSAGKVVMECVIETKASTILQFIHGLGGDVHLTFEEGTWAGWLYDLLKPHVTELVVCNPRKNALLKEGSKSDRIDARKLAELLYMSKLSSVYHGEHGLRMLKELSRSYLTISKDLGAGPFPVPGRKSTHRIIVRNGSPRFTKQACAGGQNFTTNNSTPYDWCANKPGKNCWPRLGSTVRRSCYARFLVLVRFERLTWWR